jgi:hypothetical protein
MRVYILLFIFLFLSQAGCSSDTGKEIYRQEAQAFCDIHQPEKWTNRAKFTVQENYDYLQEQINSVIRSPEFLAIFKRLSDRGYKNFYHAIQPEISKLIGKEWTCPDAEAFYNMKWEKVDAQSQLITVTLTVLPDEKLQIDNDVISLSDTDSIATAIKASAQGRDYKVMLRVPEGTTDSTLSTYFSPLIKLKIKNVSVRYY